MCECKKAAAHNCTDGHRFLVSAEVCRASWGQKELGAAVDTVGWGRWVLEFWNLKLPCWSGQPPPSFSPPPHPPSLVLLVTSFTLPLLLPGLSWSHSLSQTKVTYVWDHLCMSWWDFFHYSELIQRGNSQMRSRFSCGISHPSPPLCTPLVLGCWHIDFNKHSPANIVFDISSRIIES